MKISAKDRVTNGAGREGTVIEVREDGSTLTYVVEFLKARGNGDGPTDRFTMSRDEAEDARFTAITGEDLEQYAGQATRSALEAVLGAKGFRHVRVEHVSSESREGMAQAILELLLVDGVAEIVWEKKFSPSTFGKGFGHATAGDWSAWGLEEGDEALGVLLGAVGGSFSVSHPNSRAVLVFR